MHTAIAADLSRKVALPEANAPFTVAIHAPAGPLRARIEALARRSGAQVKAETERFDLLLMVLDSATALPASIEMLRSSAPSPASVCVIWVGEAPRRGAVSRLLRVEVAGVVSLDITPHRFQSALRAIRSGLQVIDPAFTCEVPESSSLTASPEELTEREQEVLAMMAEGLSNKEISSRMHISTHTVKFHISSILGKLGATSRTEAVSIGIRSGRVTI